MTDREAILAALIDRSDGPRPMSVAQPIALEDLWSHFASELRSLGGELVGPEVSQRLIGKKISCDEDALALVDESSFQTSSVWDAEIGITLADFAVAETGSLMLSTGQDRLRLNSLAPPIHLVFVRRATIVARLEDAIEKLSLRTAVLVTGTSRTADIEGILVRGIHGPRELWVHVVE